MTPVGVQPAMTETESVVRRRLADGRNIADSDIHALLAIMAKHRECLQHFADPATWDRNHKFYGPPSDPIKVAQAALS